MEPAVVSVRVVVEMMEAVDMERTWSRLETERRVSREERVGGEWVSTMGGEWRGPGGGSWDWLDTDSGGDSDDVGSVDRVRLSRNGGPCDSRRDAWNESGSSARGGGVGSSVGRGSCRASDSDARLGDGGVVEGGGVPDRDCGRDQELSQRKTGVLAGGMRGRGGISSARLSVLRRDSSLLASGVLRPSSSNMARTRKYHP